MFNQNPFIQQMQAQLRQELEQARRENEKALCRLLLHYFEISSMLYYSIEHSYKLLCDIIQLQTEIMNIDIIAKADRDYNVMMEQYNKRSTENFEKYYAKK